jgi:ABC-2 type transport system ATP-binding protein
MIEVQGLTKYFGRLAAINNISFTVQTGSVVGFLGPNGAGKTTTMRMLTCYTPPSSGSIRILGMDALSDSMKIRRNLGYLPENVPLYDWMRVCSYLDFVCRAKGVPSGNRKAEIERVSSSVGLDDVMGKLVKWLSKGYRQRLGLAQALIGDPPIIILDEPTIGLDPRQIREIRSLIKGLSKNKTVILSTHILPEVSQICDRVIIINRGTLVAEDTPSNLMAVKGKSRRCSIAVRAPETDLTNLLSAAPGVLSVKTGASEIDGVAVVTVESLPEVEVRSELARLIVARGWDLLELKSIDFSLEDVFIDLITEEPIEPQSTENLQNKEVA